MRCPTCRGRLGSPTKGRRTGLWIATCPSCGYSQRSNERGDLERVDGHSEMFVAQAGPTFTPGSQPWVRFDRPAVATQARQAILAFKRKKR